MDFSHISFYALSAFINFFSSFFFGTFVYLQNRNSPVGRSFARFMWTIALWSLLYALLLQAQEVDYDTVLLLSRITVVPAVFISITAFHFITHFLGKAEKYGKVTLFGYVVFTFFAILCLFSPLFIEKVRPISQFNYWAKGGLLFHPFIVLWAAYFVMFFMLLLTSYKGADRVKKAQIRMTLLGTILGNLGGSSGWILFYDIPIIPPIIVLSLLVLAYGYAVLKHHLFSIRMFAVEIFTFAIWFVLLVKILAVSQTGGLVFFDIAIFLSVVIIGSFLIRTGVKESQQREKLAELNAALDYLNKNLQEKVDEQTKEIRTAYEVEKEARKELEKLNEAKNEFVLASQHNLRTPITIAKGYVEEAGSRLKEEGPAHTQEYLEKTSGVLETLARLVNGLIDVTDLKVGKEGFSKKE